MSRTVIQWYNTTIITVIPWYNHTIIVNTVQYNQYNSTVTHTVMVMVLSHHQYGIHYTLPCHSKQTYKPMVLSGTITYVLYDVPVRHRCTYLSLDYIVGTGLAPVSRAWLGLQQYRYNHMIMYHVHGITEITIPYQLSWNAEYDAWSKWLFYLLILFPNELLVAQLHYFCCVNYCYHWHQLQLISKVPLIQLTIIWYWLSLHLILDLRHRIWAGSRLRPICKGQDQR